MVTFESDGSLTFRIYLPHAQSVALVASFTDWTERALLLSRDTRLAKDEDPGWWTLNVHTSDGDHAFSYLVDAQWWLPDYAAHGVRRNAHGSWTSLLFVPPPPRILTRLERRCRFHDETPVTTESVITTRAHAHAHAHS
jgi:1,4-alpha-glucan branching enzyme